MIIQMYNIRANINYDWIKIKKTEEEIQEMSGIMCGIIQLHVIV